MRSPACVLVGHVVLRGVVAVRMADVGEHLVAARPDVDLARVSRPSASGAAPGRGDARSSHSRASVYAEDVAARAAELVHRLGTDGQRVRGVRAAGRRSRAGVPLVRQALHERLDLDVVDLGSGSSRRAGQPAHNGRAIERRRRNTAGRVRPSSNAQRTRARSRLVASTTRRSSSGACAPAGVEVDVGGDQAAIGRSVHSGEQRAVLVYQRLAVPTRGRSSTRRRLPTRYR